MDIVGLIQNKQQQLESSLQVVIDHPVSKGDQCEDAWIGFFRSFLPSKYAVDKGFVFDSEGHKSEQIDIIIYDALYAPLIFESQAKEKFITVESVYAVFDSKQIINKHNLEYTDNKIKSVVSMHRTSRAMFVAGQRRPKRSLTHILGGILATTSISSNNVEKHCAQYPNIDLGCAPSDFSFLVKHDAQNGQMTGFTCSSREEAVLSFFYILLDELYKQGTVAGLDIRDYVDNTISSVSLERNENDL
jgi:hypothetical protein